MRARGRVGLVASLGALSLGCSIAPRDFRGLNDPAPLVRARAVGLGEPGRVAEVIPALIDRLDDPDVVVRLSAGEELKRRTGRDFGFVAYAEPGERAAAVGRWRAWQAAGTVPSPTGAPVRSTASD